jgi:hypothetical protein
VGKGGIRSNKRKTIRSKQPGQHNIVTAQSPPQMGSIKASCRVPTGKWGILLDPNLGFNIYLIFNNYLVIKFLLG